MLLDPFKPDTVPSQFKPTDLVHTYVMTDPKIEKGQKTFLHPHAWTDETEARLALLAIRKELRLDILVNPIQIEVQVFLMNHAKQVPATSPVHEAQRVVFLERWVDWHYGAHDPKKDREARREEKRLAKLSRQHKVELKAGESISEGGIVIPPTTDLTPPA